MTGICRLDYAYVVYESVLDFSFVEKPCIILYGNRFILRGNGKFWYFGVNEEDI